MARGPQRRRRRGGRVLDVLVVLVCAGVLLHSFAVEPFHVPTGSMAPTLLGYHADCVCACCGLEVPVGRARGNAWARCPNCGADLTLDGQEVLGDHFLVNKAAFALRRPRRWQVVVFRLFGIVLIKRVVALPGETVLIHDGDVVVDGQLARKPFAQAWAMRIPVFVQDCGPTSGWEGRWQPPSAAAELHLDGRRVQQTLTHCSGPAVDGKYPPFTDEYAYNAGRRPTGVPVHDFLIEADVEVRSGAGTLALRLCDGQDWVEVALPTGQAAPVTTRSWPLDDPASVTTWTDGAAAGLLRTGSTCHVQMAFVDRRLNVRVEGRPVVTDVDLPEPTRREGVAQPVQLVAAGTAVVVRGFRLYRDVHYGCQGRTAVDGVPVRLGVDQYFVLGDNSANSEDSRFWPPDALSESQIIGPAFLLHLPSRGWRWQMAAFRGAWQVPDVPRMRWIR